jgi:hypothetical protein
MRRGACGIVEAIKHGSGGARRTTKTAVRDFRSPIAAFVALNESHTSRALSPNGETSRNVGRTRAKPEAKISFYINVLRVAEEAVRGEPFSGPNSLQQGILQGIERFWAHFAPYPERRSADSAGLSDRDSREQRNREFCLASRICVSARFVFVGDDAILIGRVSAREDEITVGTSAEGSRADARFLA